MSTDIFGSAASDSICRDGLHFILDAMDRQISLNWLGTLDKPIATTLAMERVHRLMYLSVAHHDGLIETIAGLPAPPIYLNGHEDEQVPNIDYFPLEKMQADGEPSPPSIDPWARGTVLAKKHMASGTSQFKQEPSSNVPSVGGSSFKSSNTGKSGSKRSGTDVNRGGGHQSRPVTTNLVDQDDVDVGKIIELDDFDTDFSSLEVSQQFSMLQKQKQQKNNGNNNDNNANQLSEFEILNAEIVKGTQNMKKGKKYSINKDGKIVPIASANNLPPYAVQPAMSISNQRDPQERRPKSKEGVLSTASGKTIRVSGSRTMDSDEFFTATNNLATTFANPEQISLNPGVSLHNNEQIRKGPPIPSDPLRASRKQFLKKQTYSSGGLGVGGDSLVFNESTASRGDVNGHDNSLFDGSSYYGNDTYSAAIANSTELNPFEGSKVSSKSHTSKPVVHYSGKVLGTRKN